MISVKRHLPSFFLIILVLIAAAARVCAAEFKTGDILFQHLASELASVISDATHSDYSHCGMVVITDNDPQVIEAVGPVQYTPLDQWISRGKNSFYAHYRPTGLSQDQIRAAVTAAEHFLGRPYDIQYELDDSKIYCSELIYKAYLAGCGIRLGTLQPLGSLNWQPHEAFIRNIAGGELPLSRMMITPEALSRSPHITLIRTNFTDP